MKLDSIFFPPICTFMAMRAIEMVEMAFRTNSTHKKKLYDAYNTSIFTTGPDKFFWGQFFFEREFRPFCGCRGHATTNRLKGNLKSLHLVAFSLLYLEYSRDIVV